MTSDNSNNSEFKVSNNIETTEAFDRSIIDNIEPNTSSFALKESSSLWYRLSILCISVLFIGCSIFMHKRFLKKPKVSVPSVKQEKITKQFPIDKIKIEQGDVISKILSSYNLPLQDIQQILKAAASKKINLEKLKTGQVLEIMYANPSSQTKIVHRMSTKLDQENKLQITKVENNYQAAIIPIPLTKKLLVLSGKIKNSIIVSAIHQGVPIQNLLEATNACGYEVDFQRDIRDGDSFKIIIEKFTSPEDGSTFFGKTLFFSLNSSRKKYNIYKFKTNDGDEDFFTDNYQSAKRGLLKTPLPIARISSRFGLRKHPILGYSKLHKGIDFAAPHGTQIYSSGDGIITEVGTKSGLGNYVKIKHTSELSTVYGHASKFAKDLTKGLRVKQGQVIAYVGMTGRATGPHLHYELLFRDKHIDPLKFKLPSTKILKAQDAENFRQHKASIESLLKNNLFT